MDTPASRWKTLVLSVQLAPVKRHVECTWDVPNFHEVLNVRLHTDSEQRPSSRR